MAWFSPDKIDSGPDAPACSPPTLLLSMTRQLFAQPHRAVDRISAAALHLVGFAANAACGGGPFDEVFTGFEQFLCDEIVEFLRQMTARFAGAVPASVAIELATGVAEAGQQ